MRRALDDLHIGPPLPTWLPLPPLAQAIATGDPSGVLVSATDGPAGLKTLTVDTSIQTGSLPQDGAFWVWNEDRLPDWQFSRYLAFLLGIKFPTRPGAESNVCVSTGWCNRLDLGATGHSFGIGAQWADAGGGRARSVIETGANTTSVQSGLRGAYGGTHGLPWSSGGGSMRIRNISAWSVEADGGISTITNAVSTPPSNVMTTNSQGAYRYLSIGVITVPGSPGEETVGLTAAHHLGPILRWESF